MKRFDMEIQPQRYYMGEGESYAVSPYESTNGDWVKCEDVSKLQSLIERIISDIEDWLPHVQKEPLYSVMNQALDIYKFRYEAINNNQTI